MCDFETIDEKYSRQYFSQHSLAMERTDPKEWGTCLSDAQQFFTGATMHVTPLSFVRMVFPWARPALAAIVVILAFLQAHDARANSPIIYVCTGTAFQDTTNLHDCGEHFLYQNYGVRSDIVSEHESLDSNCGDPKQLGTNANCHMNFRIGNAGQDCSPDRQIAVNGVGCGGTEPACVGKTAGKQCPALGQSSPDLQCGDPIAISIGDKTVEEVDFVASGQNPLRLIRHYNSDGGAGAAYNFAVGWMHNYAMSIIPVAGSTSVFVTRPDGKAFVFHQSGSSWLPDADISDSLSALPRPPRVSAGVETSQHLIHLTSSSSQTCLEQLQSKTRQRDICS